MRLAFSPTDYAVHVSLTLPPENRLWKLTSWGTPSSQPLMTRPTPIWVTKGLPRSRDESNLDPSRRVPTSVTRYQQLLFKECTERRGLTVHGDGVTGLGEVLAVTGRESLDSNTHCLSC